MREREYDIQIDGRFTVTKTIVAESKDEAYEIAEDFLEDLFLDSHDIDCDWDFELCGDVTSIDESEIDYEEDFEDF